MLEGVILDAHPLSLACQRRGRPEADACRRWIADCTRAGIRILVPEVADYEVRRELIRAGKASALARLDQFNLSVPGRYIPITTVAMRRAAELWAASRQQGSPTAPAHALDGDVILAGQALTLSVPAGNLVVATRNVRHLALFLRADLWQNITP